MAKNNNEGWTTIIRPKESLWKLNLKELWDYRDLCSLFIRRDITTAFKQTVLGPLWFIIQPTMTVIMYMVVFGGIAKIPTDGLPQPLFYLAGVSLWGYFSGCLGKRSRHLHRQRKPFRQGLLPPTHRTHLGLVSGLLNFGIQMAIFAIVYCVYVFGHLPGSEYL